MKQYKRIKWGVGLLAVAFIAMNVVAVFHSYKFTHFADSELERTKAPKSLTAGQKVKALIFGVTNPRPQNKTSPTNDCQTIKLQSTEEIECWVMTTENPKGTVVLFHGFSDSKSSLLDKSDVFREIGYNTFLVDFIGSGGSGGNRTTIGFFEAGQVKTCFDYLTESGEKNIYLFGTSMGAAAILKSISDCNISPKGIILECPFGSAYQTVCARFKNMRLPTFPMAGLLVFWAGLQNGFWAFAHNPVDYAKKITCPTLLLHGANDENVSQQEIEGIFKNLAGEKELKIYQGTGHENYLTQHKEEWTQDVQQFLTKGQEK